MYLSGGGRDEFVPLTGGSRGVGEMTRFICQVRRVHD